MNVRRRTMAACAVVAAVLIGAAIPALGQVGSEEPTPSGSPEAGKGKRSADFAARLAEELGLPAERVQAALETVEADLREEWQAERVAALRERLGQAVADGRLTREQVDAILEAAEAGVLPGDG